MLWAIALIPWLLLALVAPLALRRRPRLADYPRIEGADAPLVSIVVPARNEEHNIGACLATLLASCYPRREIVVVDDASTDMTGEIARALAARSPVPVTVITGEPLPPGWFGKPWACAQGVRRARGELLLFTDADTRHDDDLLGHAVGALDAERADLVTALGRQELCTFWERLVMPHVLTMIFLRYGGLRRINRPRDPRDVIANGQFILVRRSVYDAVGGHEAVRGEVVEDLRLAQRVAMAGHRVFAAHAEELLETRMYRRLRDLVEGWSKNLAAGSRHTVSPWLRPFLPWLIAAWLLVMWVVPPAVLAAAALGPLGAAALRWALGATGASLFFWAIMNWRSGAPIRYCVLYPIGALACAGLFVRSALLGERVTWKGRAYGAPQGERRS
ncbi:MAG TPA: glycosyltransferase family 2 protein [Longimicrobiales bacterium]|nr:glycosyltransferase family 2 protein [Longimicrobiales bacterium]